MLRKPILILCALLTLIWLSIPAASQVQDLQITRERIEPEYTSGGLFGSQTLMCPPMDSTELMIQPADLDELGLQVFSILSALDSYCQAYYLENGRMPENLAELQESGWFLFDPVEQSYSTGLKLTDEDVEIKLSELTPQEYDGGPDVVPAVDWNSSQIPGLTVLSGLLGMDLPDPIIPIPDPDPDPDPLPDAHPTSPASDRMSIRGGPRPPVPTTRDPLTYDQLEEELQSWSSLYVDFTSTGILLAGFGIDQTGHEIHHSPVLPNMMVPEIKGRGRLEATATEIESPGSWIVLDVPNPPGDVGAGAYTIAYCGSEYQLSKGDTCGLMDSEAGEDSTFYVTPWVLASSSLTRPLDWDPQIRPVDWDPEIRPSDWDPSERQEQQSPEVIRAYLMMDLCGQLLDDYVSKHQTVPQNAIELLGGMWSVNSTASEYLTPIAPGAPGSCRMIIIIENMPSPARVDVQGRDRMIIDDNERPAPGRDDGQGRGRKGAINPDLPYRELDFDAYFELTPETGITKVFRRMLSPDDDGSYWQERGGSIGEDLASRGIIIVNGHTPGWGFTPLRLNPEIRPVLR